ncbi:MAG: Holliday junction resolvase RuvX [Flavihumibacter sp.]
MARIMAIDYGKKRTGIAVTDPLQIIATGLTTVDTKDIFPFLEKYFAAEAVELVLLGEPENWDGSATHATPLVAAFKKAFIKKFPSIPVQGVDERYTSKMARQSMVESGMKKKQRQIKANVDIIAATILLQAYLHDR